MGGYFAFEVKQGDALGAQSGHSVGTRRRFEVMLVIALGLGSSWMNTQSAAEKESRSCYLLLRALRPIGDRYWTSIESFRNWGAKEIGSVER